MKKIFLNLFLLSVFCGLSLSAQNFVIDEANILDSSAVSVLESKCQKLSQKYNCGVYLVTVEDYQANDYPGYIEDYSYDYYMSKNFGIGNQKNGLMLILSMAERDFDIMAYGDFGNAAFTDFGKQKLEESFIPKFADNQWKAGFAKYLNKTEFLLKWAAAGKPYDEDNYLAIKLEVLPKAFLIALLVSVIFAVVSSKAKKDKTTNIISGIQANDYIVSDNIKFGKKLDEFTHTTESRTHIPQQSSSTGNHHHSSPGGTSVRSNGSSHHSGKF